MAHNFEKIKISPIALGHWRLPEWKLSARELLDLTEKCIDIGVDTIDSADIYGDYSCEQLFGKALALKPLVRSKIKLVTKCGIRLLSKKFPDVFIKHYEYSYRHIVNSVEQSLRNFGTDYIDLLLLHRPSPLLNPAEVAMAFSHLRQSGKVLHFGISNFQPLQIDILQSYLDVPLVVNQVEISPLKPNCIHNGTLDYMMAKRIIPMAWSPLAGGKLLNPVSNTERRVFQSLQQAGQMLKLQPEQVAISWLITHPSGIIPVIGTGNFQRIKMAIEASTVTLEHQHWFSIYRAILGRDVD